MYCQTCHYEVVGQTKYCCKKCQDIYRLRNRAIKQLLDAEEKTHGEGYDSDVKRRWIAGRIEALQSGKKDNEIYNSWLSKK